MLFNSYVFLFLFLPIVLAVWWGARDRPSFRLAFLTAASYVFYGYWDWRFTLLMLASTMLDFVCGARMGEGTGPGHGRKRWLLLSLVGNLGMLGVFKYLGFFTRSLNALLGLAHFAPMAVIDITLPVGISFYTFQSLSYSIDVYRGNARPSRNFIAFAAYVSMFPQLVAGPIVRYVEVEAQFRSLPRTLDPRVAEAAIRFFVIGLAKKVLIADTIAVRIDPLLASWHQLDFWSGWWTALGYTGQLYFDFSGYSDMAVGLGLMLGFFLPINFNSPYKALDPSDFWRRWHISLSTWLRDYLYIGLGGNRKGPRRTLVNLMLTMFLGGLWHGAAWTFVIWGVYHGTLLALHHTFRRSYDALPVLLRWTVMFLAVVAGWVLFRSTSFEMARHWSGAMLGLHGMGAGPLAFGLDMVAVATVPIAIAVFAKNVWEMRPRSPLWGIVWAALFILAVMRLGGESPFLYFQF